MTLQFFWLSPFANSLFKLSPLKSICNIFLFLPLLTSSNRVAQIKTSPIKTWREWHRNHKVSKVIVSPQMTWKTNKFHISFKIKIEIVHYEHKEWALILYTHAPIRNWNLAIILKIQAFEYKHVQLCAWAFKFHIQQRMNINYDLTRFKNTEYLKISSLKTRFYWTNKLLNCQVLSVYRENNQYKTVLLLKFESFGLEIHYVATSSTI